ncbi:MAG: archaellin/type IV pilin N-terminal domain-containing protein [Candidatus Bathyarchaeia archaeon]|nr:hypothetical protein [Candidatus Bathyarchaeota archaeon]
MNSRTLLKSRSGISPILATLLLIVIAVAAIVVTYAWIMTYMSSAQQQGSVLLTLDSVGWPNNKTIVLYVRNAGTADARIDKVYIGDSANNLQPATHDAENSVVPANGGTLTINVTQEWTSGTTYYFKVVPKTGAPLEFSRKAP